MKVATKMSGIALATAAAAMFLAAPMAYADGAASTGKCVGGNSCKGQGFTMATAADCAKAGGTMAPAAK